MQLKKLFYPRQEVAANGEFDANGQLDGSSISINFEVFNESPGEDLSFFAQLTLILDSETSVNPPYFFNVQSFAAFQLVAGEIDATGKVIDSVRLIAYQLLVGATRERLAEITSRGPWPQFLVSPLPMHYADPNSQEISK